MHVCFQVYDMKVERGLWKWRKGSIGRQKVEQYRAIEYTCHESRQGDYLQEEGDSQNKKRMNDEGNGMNENESKE